MDSHDAEIVNKALKGDWKNWFTIVAHLLLIGYLYRDIIAKVDANQKEHLAFKEQTIRILDRLENTTEKLADVLSAQRIAPDRLKAIEDRIFRLEGIK